MILVDLIPPGLTFRDLVGPSGAVGYTRGKEPEPLMPVRLRAERSRAMRLIEDQELLQTYTISERDEGLPARPEVDVQSAAALRPAA